MGAPDKHQYPGFVWLAYDRWVRREHIPPNLLAPYDSAWERLKREPNDVDAGARWLDAADAIRTRVNPILDEQALRACLEADTLRKVNTVQEVHIHHHHQVSDPVESQSDLRKKLFADREAQRRKKVEDRFVEASTARAAAAERLRKLRSSPSLPDPRDLAKLKAQSAPVSDADLSKAAAEAALNHRRSHG
jgi:hypothetical protein